MNSSLFSSALALRFAACGKHIRAMRRWRCGLTSALALCVGMAGIAAEATNGAGDRVAARESTGSSADMTVNADLAAEKAARRFLEACAASDWDTVRELWTAKLDDRVKQVLGGLEVFAVGEAESSRVFPGVRMVPYEIRFKGASRNKKQKLTMKPDKQTGRWVVDGGI